MIAMNQQTTYVMREPHVRVVDGEFRFTGEAKSVDVKSSSVLDYLRAVGLYDSQADVYNGSVWFDKNFSVKEKLGEVDEVMSLLDDGKLKEDLDKKGYAFLTAKGNAGKFKDYRGKGHIANLDRVIQGIIFQRIAKELKMGSDVRHLKAQESVELMLSNKEYNEKMNDFWAPNSEVIQVLEKQPVSSYSFKDGKLDVIDTAETLTPAKASSVRSYWFRLEARPLVDAVRPLDWNGGGVAVLKMFPAKK